VTIVVSPLLSLMKDQVTRLRDYNIQCASWTSETTLEQRSEVLAYIYQSQIVPEANAI
jgi:bloom syndrome protein